jgi:hypothetical protein
MARTVNNGDVLFKALVPFHPEPMVVGGRVLARMEGAGASIPDWPNTFLSS